MPKLISLGRSNVTLMLSVSVIPDASPAVEGTARGDVHAAAEVINVLLRLQVVGLIFFGHFRDAGRGEIGTEYLRNHLGGGLGRGGGGGGKGTR